MEHNLTRRKFLVSAAALGALALSSGCAPKAMEEQEDAQPQMEVTDIDSLEVKYSWCYMCGPAKTFCATRNYMKDGKWVHVEGNPEAGNNWGYGSKTLCAKGNAAMQTLYNPARLEYPMRRVGEKGEGKFERCSWDEALEGIASKLLENREKYGPESYAALSPQACKFVQQLGRRFLNVYGSPNYLHSAICVTQIVSSQHISIGRGARTMPGQLDKTKLLVSWGVNGENSAVNNVMDAHPVVRFDAME